MVVHVVFSTSNRSNKKLESWERFYNFDRPHGSFEGKMPYETLRSLLTNRLFCPGGSDVLQLTGKSFMTKSLISYGYNLQIVYFVWIAVVLALYPFCKKYNKYKMNNKSKWWLSYL